MNFFKKNLLVVAPLIIAISLLSMIPCVGGLQDMTRSLKLRGAAKSGAVAEPYLPSTSSSSSSSPYPATRYFYHQPQPQGTNRDSLESSGPSLSSSNNFQHAPFYYRDQYHQDQVGVAADGSDESPSSSSSSHKSPEITRVYRLYNLRSFHDILVLDKKVSATGTNLDEKGDLSLESVLKGNVVRTRIRGILSDKYICFNKRGRLVLRPKKSARGDKCEFIEQSTEVGSRFSSALEPRWHIGFTTKGQALNGAAYDPDQSGTFACPSCFLFLKTSTYHKDKYPSNYTQHNFDLFSHNRAIGQFHPGLRPEDFLSEIKFPFQQTAFTSTSAPTLRPSPNPSPSSSSQHHDHRHSKHPHHRRTRRKNKLSKSSPQNSVSAVGSGHSRNLSDQDKTEPELVDISSKYSQPIPDSQNISITSGVSYNAVPIDQFIYNSSNRLDNSNSATSNSSRNRTNTDSSRRLSSSVSDNVKELPEPLPIRFIPSEPVLESSPISTSTQPPPTTSTTRPRTIARLRRIKKTQRNPSSTGYNNSNSSNRINNGSIETSKSTNYTTTTPTTTTSTTSTRLPTSTAKTTTTTTTTSKTVPSSTVSTTTLTPGRPTTVPTSFSKPTTRHRRRHRHHGHHHYAQMNQTSSTVTTSTVRPPHSRKTATATATTTTIAPQLTEFISKLPRWR